MPAGPHRTYGAHHLHFITCSCYQELPFPGTARTRDCFLSALEQTRQFYRFLVVGYIVMPEHIHLLIGEPGRGTPSTVMQVLKQKVSYRLRRRRRAPAAQLRIRFDRSPDLLPRFWQFRFYDFNVWSHKRRVEKLQYMHFNPVKRGLVAHPKDWPWSSFSFYSDLKSGLIRIDPVN